MFEEKRTLNGLRIILPPIEQRPVYHKCVKRAQTVTPLDRLKALRKLQRLKKNA